MATQNEETPVKDLPYYNTLREALLPYQPAKDKSDATEFFSSAEIIASIEQHHGVPQGPVGKEIERWIMPGDFVRAMEQLGFRAINTGGLQLTWLMKKK